MQNYDGEFELDGQEYLFRLDIDWFCTKLPVSHNPVLLCACPQGVSILLLWSFYYIIIQTIISQLGISV